MAHVHNLLEALKKLNKHYKNNFNRVTRFPPHFISSSWIPPMRKLPTCQSQRGGRYQYHPKSQCRPQGWCQLSHEKTSAQCLKCREQWVSITHTAPRNGISHQLLPYLLKHECSHKMFWCIPDSFSSAEKSSVSIKKLFRIDDAPATALCLIAGSNKAVTKWEPCCPFLFSPYPVYQSCSYKGGVISCSCIPQSRREIPLCLLSWKDKQQWWAYGDQSLPTLQSAFIFRPDMELKGKSYSWILFIQVAEDNLTVWPARQQPVSRFHPENVLNQDGSKVQHKRLKKSNSCRL